MAKLSDLILRTSEVTGIAEATVREVSRRLREGGLIQTGKGGRYGGASMTPKDAASLLTGLLIVKASSPSFAEIASSTKDHLESLTSHVGVGHRMVLARWNPRLGLAELCELKSGHTFGDALAVLISLFSNGEFERGMTKWGWVDLEIRIFSPKPGQFRTLEPQAEIEFKTEAFGNSTLNYFRRRIAKRVEVRAPRKWSEIGEGAMFDLTVGAIIKQDTLKSIGLLIKNAESSNG
jgi:hypothetical protein